MTTSMKDIFERFWTHTNNKIKNETNKFGGTIEVTANAPTKENTVLTINPDAEDIGIYTATEVDAMITNLSDKMDELEVGGGDEVFIVELTTYEGDNGLTEYKSSASPSEIYEAYTKGKTILCNLYKQRNKRYYLVHCTETWSCFSNVYPKVSNVSFLVLEEIEIHNDYVIHYEMEMDTSVDDEFIKDSTRAVQNKVVTAKFEEVDEKFNETDGKFEEIKNSRTHYSEPSWETIYQEDVELYEGQGALTKGANVEIGKSYNLLIKESSTGTVVAEEVCVAMPAEEGDLEIGIVLMGSESGVVFIYPEYFEMLGAYGMVQLINSLYTGALNVSVQAEKEVVKTLDAKYLPPLTLGIHTDGLMYVFVDGEPVGNGIDCYTKDKKDEIVNDVVSSLPTWNGGTY